MDRKELEHCIAFLNYTYSPNYWFANEEAESDKKEYDQKMDYVKEYVYENIDTVNSEFGLEKKFYDNFCDWLLTSPPEEIDIQMLRKMCGDRYFIDKVHGTEFLCYFEDHIFISFDNYTPIYRQIFNEIDLFKFIDAKVTLNEKSVCVEYPYQTISRIFKGYPGNFIAPDLDEIKKEVQENIEYMTKSADRVISKLEQRDLQGVKELTELIKKQCWVHCYLIFYKKLFDCTDNMDGWEDWYKWIDSSLYHE